MLAQAGGTAPNRRLINATAVGPGISRGDAGADLYRPGGCAHDAVAQPLWRDSDVGVFLRRHLLHKSPPCTWYTIEHF